MEVASGAGARSTRFVRSNLALLGFGNSRDALVQAVKELFENALDATGAMGASREWGDERLDLLRVVVRASNVRGCVDVVCADTGSGIRAQHVKKLCCGIFETTKRSGENKTAVMATAGKYGVGLKAAILYSQLSDSTRCLRVVTTSRSNEVLCVKLQINPDCEEAAVVQNVAHFAVDESHQRFSGTEMRLTLPCPEVPGDLEDAADSLAVYFQTLAYTLPPFVSVRFTFDVFDTNAVVDLRHHQEPIDRFIADLGAVEEELVYEYQEHDGISVSCMGTLRTSDNDTSSPSEVSICLLRFVNHIPLLNADDLFTCGLTTGITAPKCWRRYGMRCHSTPTHLVNQLVATRVGYDLKARSGEAALLVVAVDICSIDSSHDIKFNSLRKTRVDKQHSHHVQCCFSAMLRQLEAAGQLLTPQQQQMEQLTSEFAPLIAHAALSIARRSQNPHNFPSAGGDASSEATVIQQLQRALHRQAAFASH